MTINHTFNQVSGAQLEFEGNELVQTLLPAKDALVEAMGSALHPTTQSFWDFDALGKTLELGNIGHAKAVKETHTERAQKREKDEDQYEASASHASNAMQEQHEERMIKIGEFEFTDADLQETLEDIIKDKKAFAEKHGLTDKQTDEAEYHAIIMVSMTKDGREAYLNQLRQTDPEIADAIAEGADLRSGGREHGVSIAGSKQTHSEIDEFIAEIREADMPMDKGFTLDM